MTAPSNGRRADQVPGPVLLGFPNRTQPLCSEYNPEISENRGTSNLLPTGQEVLKGFAGVNKRDSAVCELRVCEEGQCGDWAG